MDIDNTTMYDIILLIQFWSSIKQKDDEKNMLNFAMVAIAMTMFAHNPVAPACALKKYPGLYTDANSFQDKDIQGKTVNKILMTLPFSSVKKTNAGKYYYVTHPILGNECSEVTDLVPDSNMNGLELVFKALDKRSDKNALIEKMDITIQLLVYKDKPTGEWAVHSIGIPNDLEVERYK